MPGDGFLLLDSTAVPRGRRADWLAAELRAAIARGALPAGARLPASRVLAGELGFARNTVAEAYRRLAEEALVVPRVGVGTVVAAPSVPSERLASPGTAGAVRPARAPRSAAPEPIDLAAGLPELAAFPRAAWLRAEREVLAEASRRTLGYQHPAGAPTLREALAAWLARSRGVVADADGIVVTSGVTGALALLADALLGEGHESVALEDPGATGNRLILEYWMPRVEPVPVDANGLVVEALRRSGADAVLVTPAHQYPSGVVLAPDRRRDLLAWASERRDRLVVEDDYDAEYRYDRRPVRALQPLAPERVAYTSSLSKTLAPALRLGWLVPPSRLVERIVERRWASGLGSPALPQLALARLLDSGALERHLRAMRGRHRLRRDAAVAAVRAQLPGVRVHGVAAGLHLLLQLPDECDDLEVAAAARELGVLVQPLSAQRQRPGPPGLIVHYAAEHPARFEQAIATIARVLGAPATAPAQSPLTHRRGRSATSGRPSARMDAGR
ncbi:PLP-dependent aminotransferase family protein [Agromyces soli]|uniref:PLP-dependent aminotransferase family protein n=1 Tax=Agromyces soli TaxID=659012 RepID=A0ABY4AQM5_9MICO|nr:PLP-dependent aminotransferase family protein [Agromyces soli]UOE25159.1 PLP-dependent aminotransferase family protein [Agromyces soli]